MSSVPGRAARGGDKTRRYRLLSILAALLLTVSAVVLVPAGAGAAGDRSDGPRPVGPSVPPQLSFNYPLSVDVAADGTVWVADTGHNQVVRVDPKHPEREERFGSGTAGATPGDFSSPTGVAHNSHGHILVVDQRNNRVVELTDDGRPLRTFGGPDSGAGGLSYPGSIAVDEHDNVYVTDIGNFRVVEYGPDARVVRTFGRRGSGDGEFTFGLFCLRTFCKSNLGTPAGIAVGGGFVYVVDAYNSRVEKFAEDGGFLAAWDRADGHRFDYPAAVALDREGHVVIAEFNGPSIDVLNTDGTPVRSWAHDGHADDALSFPQGVAVGSQGVLVADSGNDRIQEFSLAGSHTGEIGTVSGLDFFESLSGVAFSPAGDIVISRPDRANVERYDSTGRRLGVIDTSAGADPLTPERLAIDNAGTIYVQATSPSAHCGPVLAATACVYRFSADGAPLGQWGHYGPGEHTIWEPKRAVVAPTGDVYVADAGRFCVERFTASAEYVNGFGLCAPDPPTPPPPPPPPPPPGCGGCPPPPPPPPPPPVRSTDDPIHNPVDVAVDSWGHVFVLDLNDPPPPPSPEPCPPGKTCGPPPPPPPSQVSRVLVFDSGGALITSWGSHGDGPGQFNAPSDLTLGPDGTVYVVDQYGHRMQVFTSSGVYVRTWQIPDLPSPGGGQIEGVAADASGNIASLLGVSYARVAGSDQRIQITSADGTLKRQWDNAGGARGRLAWPRDAQPIGNGNLLVSDSTNARIVEFTEDGTFVRQIGSKGSGPGEFLFPDALVRDGHGGVLIGDNYLSRVQDLTLDGHVRSVWGSAGTGDGQFSSGPRGLAVAPDGTVYAVDIDGHRVEHFTANGGFLGWAGRCSDGPNCDVAHGHSRGFRCTAATCTGLSAGRGPGQFDRPYELAFDNAGRLLVTEINNGRVQAMNLDGNTSDLWPIPPPQPSQSVAPEGIAVDRWNHVYVADFTNNSILILDGHGHLLGRWGSLGGGKTQLTLPTRVRVSGDTVFVTDTGNSRILRFHTFPGDEASGPPGQAQPGSFAPVAVN